MLQYFLQSSEQLERVSLFYQIYTDNVLLMTDSSHSSNSMLLPLLAPQILQIPSQVIISIRVTLPNCKKMLVKYHLKQKQWPLQCSCQVGLKAFTHEFVFPFGQSCKQELITSSQATFLAVSLSYRHCANWPVVRTIKDVRAKKVPMHRFF